MLAPVLEHLREARPFFGGLVLAAELALAVAPAAVGDHSRKALVDAGGVKGDGAAEAGADDRHARAVDGAVVSEKAQGIAGVFHLFQTDDAAELALALPA